MENLLKYKTILKVKELSRLKLRNYRIKMAELFAFLLLYNLQSKLTHIISLNLPNNLMRLRFSFSS